MRQRGTNCPFVVFAMLCSDTLAQSGVGVNSSCEGAFIGDTCKVFCAEVYQVVSNETSTSTRACNRRDNSLCLFFGVDFSKCFFTGRLSECARQEASLSQAVVSLLHLDGKTVNEGDLAERTSEPKLDPSDRQALTQRAVKCLRCLTRERISRSSSDQPDRRRTL